LLLRIKYGYNGPGESLNEYQFIVFEEGSAFRVVTNEEWRARVAAIVENEGNEAATRWVQSSVWTCPEIDSTWSEVLSEFQAMVTHWEAMLQLKLFIPAVTMTPFRGNWS
jgi:hypothetical protein